MFARHRIVGGLHQAAASMSGRVRPKAVERVLDSRRLLRLERLEDRNLLSMTALGAGLLSVDPSGSEFRISSTATGSQLQPAVAADASGNATVVWNGWGNSGGNGVYARQYNAAGTALGAEFQLTNQATGWSGPDIAMRGNGDFVVVWTNQFVDGDGYGIAARLFTAAGVPRGPAFQVNVTTEDNQRDAAVAMDANGNFAVVWEANDLDDLGVYFRRFDANGTPLTGEVRVNGETRYTQEQADIAMDSQGNAVIVWVDMLTIGWGISGRPISATGDVGSQFPVDVLTSTGMAFTLNHPAIAMNGNGTFVVAWSHLAPTSSTTTCTPGSTPARPVWNWSATPTSLTRNANRR